MYDTMPVYYYCFGSSSTPTAPAVTPSPAAPPSATNNNPTAGDQAVAADAKAQQAKGVLASQTPTDTTAASNKASILGG